VANDLVEQVQQNIQSCRNHWWDRIQHLCLDRKKVVRLKRGYVKLDSNEFEGVGVIVRDSGRWRGVNAHVKVRWSDGGLSHEVCKE
jgi:hypothetical protein